MSWLADMAGSVAGGIAETILPGSMAYQQSNAQKDANKEAKKAAQKQMDFQQYNSNTAYQRAMEDMKKAGLNPALAYQQGGASVPSGSTYTPGVVEPTSKIAAQSISNTAQRISQFIGLSNQMKQTEASVQQAQAQTQQLQAQTAETKMNTAIKARELPQAEMKHDVMRGIQNFIKPITDMFKNSARPANVTPAQQRDMDEKIRKMKEYRK